MKISFSIKQSSKKDVIMKVYFDGSPNKIALVIEDKNLTFPIEPIPVDRPLEIEYNALIQTLAVLNENTEYVLYSDNQSLVARLNCDHELPSSKFDVFHEQVLDLINKKKLSVQVRWVPRKYNLAGKLL